MKKQIQYRFRKIDIAQFAMFLENGSDQIKEVAFKTDTQFGFDKDQNVLTCSIGVAMYKYDKLLLKIELRCSYEITAETIENLRQDNQYVFAPRLLIQFASLCYGTLRGVMHTKTLNTPINSFVLPPVYFDDLIKEPFVIPC
jgi:hypothetical protein